MRSFKLALGFVLTATVAAAQSYPSPIVNNTTVNGDFYTPSKTGYFYGNGGSAAGFSTTIPTNVLTGTLGIANGGTGLTALGTGVAAAFAQPVTGTGGIVLAKTPVFQTTPTGSLSTPVGFNNPIGPFVYTASDNAASTTTPGQHIPTLFNVEGTFGGSAVNDGRNGIASYINLTSATSSSNAYRYYTAGNFFADMNVSDNGTSGSPQGNAYGLGAVARLRNGATNYASLISAEFNIAANTGSSVAFKAALSLLPWPEDKVAGTVVDADLWISAGAGGIGQTNAIEINNYGGLFPVIATGSIIRAQGGTVATGIDFNSMVSMSGNVLQWNSGSYSLAWTGAASLGTASFAVGGTNPVKIGDWLAGYYGSISFNSSFTNGGTLGIAGGASGDPELYLMMPTNGFLVVRSNGATTNTLTLGNPFPGTSTKTICSDASHNWFEKTGAC